MVKEWTVIIVLAEHDVSTTKQVWKYVAELSDVLIAASC